jgi:hypothetical protein
MKRQIHWALPDWHSPADFTSSQVSYNAYPFDDGSINVGKIVLPK